MKKLLFVLLLFATMSFIFLSCSEKDVPEKEKPVDKQLMKYSECLKKYIEKEIVLLSNKHDIDKEKLTNLLIVINYPNKLIIINYPDKTYFKLHLKYSISLDNFDFSDVDTTLVLDHFDDYEDYFNNLSKHFDIDKDKLASIMLNFEIVDVSDLYNFKIFKYKFRSSEDSEF